MPNVEKHAPGTFSWVELATTDQSAAKAFYSALFGWAPNDMPIGPEDTYTIFRLQGRDAAAGYSMRQDEREMGVPSHWNLYIAVANTDEAAKRAAALGGHVLASPFDVGDAGRMAVIQDPTGAIFHLWQANRNPGIGITGVEGTLCWADLSTADPATAKQFYEKLFNWQITTSPNDTSGYLHIKAGEDFIGGIPPTTNRPANAPPHWMVYFFVNDVDASSAKVTQLGGKIIMPAMTLEKVGRFSLVADPQGAMFLVFGAAPQQS